MSSLISPTRSQFGPSNPRKLEEVQKNAALAIQRLRESEPSEVADVLVARYEELMKRHEQLKELQANHEHYNTSQSEQQSEKEVFHSGIEASIDQLEDGSFKITVPSNIGEEPKVYVLHSPDFDEKNPIKNTLLVAEELVKAGVEIVDSNLDNLGKAQMTYVTDLYESLSAQKDKLDSMLAADGSSMAIDVVAQLYLKDSLAFLQSAQLVSACSK
ncbi:hypothetical protein H0H93_015999 [Arthromyces matolae]|nr:hypothetical protein H0H93_015999 [Arthromyces matolae]